MTHCVITAGAVGPVVKRFDDPVRFRDYMRELIDTYGPGRLLWVSPFQVRFA